MFTLYNQQFQFHKGTIKTTASLQQEGKIQAFQFHKGTIKTYLRNLQKHLLTISIP